MTMVFSVIFRSSRVLSSLPTSPSCSSMPSAYSLPGMPLCPCMDWRTWVKACMRVVFIQTKNGLSALTCLSMKLIAAWVVSSSMVSMRLLFSAPVSSILPSALDLITPRGEAALTKGSLGSFGQ
ncbi:hypothetical protein D3C78_1115070 [compost metagenome]